MNQQETFSIDFQVKISLNDPNGFFDDFWKSIGGGFASEWSTEYPCEDFRSEIEHEFRENMERMFENIIDNAVQARLEHMFEESVAGCNFVTYPGYDIIPYPEYDIIPYHGLKQDAIGHDEEIIDIDPGFSIL